MKVSNKGEYAILRMSPAEAAKLLAIMRSPSGHCDWCNSYPECTDECVVPLIDMAAKKARRCLTNSR